MGRPKLDRSLHGAETPVLPTIKIPAEMQARLRRRARDLKVSQSQLVRLFIADGLGMDWDD